MTPSESSTLAAQAGLDVELTQALAATFDGLALWFLDQTNIEQRNPRRSGDAEAAFEDGSAAFPADVQQIQSYVASLSVAAACYWLLSGEDESARRCYRVAFDNSQAMTDDDRRILAICAGRDTLDADVPSSEFGAMLTRLAAECLPDRAPPMADVIVPGDESPILRITVEDLAELVGLVSAIRSVPGAKLRAEQLRIRAATTVFRSVLSRASRSVERARTDWRWGEQMGTTLPIEPELLALSLLYAAWSSRVLGDSPLPEAPMASLVVTAAISLRG